MTRRLVAVTDISHNRETTISGDPIDPTKFSKEQIQALYESGALRIEEVPDVVPVAEVAENSDPNGG